VSKFFPKSRFSSSYSIKAGEPDVDPWLDVLTNKEDGVGTVGGEVAVPRYRFLYLLVVPVTLLLIFRAGSLQIAQGAKNRELADGNRIRSVTIFSTRGIIYDRNHQLLARDTPQYRISITPSDIPKDPPSRASAIQRVASVTHIPAADIRAAITTQTRTNPFASTLLKQPIDQETALQLQANGGQLRGVTVSITPSRQYPAGESFSQILGYTGSITQAELASEPAGQYDLNAMIGKSGIEQSYESTLRGQNGKQQVEVDSTGRPNRVLGGIQPVPGNDVVLSIDEGLQNQFYNSLAEQVQKFHAPGGAGVAIDPRTGEILAMVSYPSFDNNLFAKGISSSEYAKLSNDPNSPLLNRTVSGTYPSGSTIKPFIGLSALKEGTISPNTTIQGVAQISVGGSNFPDWTLHSGAVNLARAIAQSVNIFFYGVVGGFNIPGVGNMKGLGPDTLAKDLGVMMFGHKTGIDIPGEATGQIPTPSWKEQVEHQPWYLGDSYHLGIGQGDFLVTPLQMAVATAAIADDGKLLKPTLVHQVVSPDGSVVKNEGPKVLNNQIAPPADIEIMQRAMLTTVEGGNVNGVSYNGSASPMRDLPVTSAGKTGTAQFGANNQYEDGWYEGYAPFNNPQIAIIALIEKGNVDGFYDALPVVHDTLKYYFSQNK
jgi:penicillin-binding protein 2